MRRGAASAWLLGSTEQGRVPGPARRIAVRHATLSSMRSRRCYATAQPARSPACLHETTTSTKTDGARGRRCMARAWRSAFRGQRPAARSSSGRRDGHGSIGTSAAACDAGAPSSRVIVAVELRCRCAVLAPSLVPWSPNLGRPRTAPPSPLWPPRLRFQKTIKSGRSSVESGPQLSDRTVPDDPEGGRYLKYRPPRTWAPRSAPRPSAAAFPVLLAGSGCATRKLSAARSRCSDPATWLVDQHPRRRQPRQHDRDGAGEISELSAMPFAVEDIAVRIGCRRGFDQIACRRRRRGSERRLRTGRDSRRRA
ncbi:hypothetical protein PVAP13_9KG645050 [Panicum virgatum]|uniref:Uncharacterized protein n=1 Tax=Panicum virgatum TaxID=38727 RepID=A0A8T0P0D8_PANVG|nr:hypothetical protein PVAP13_9KG645050 [Panicum virgatum]